MFNPFKKRQLAMPDTIIVQEITPVQFSDEQAEAVFEALAQLAPIPGPVHFINFLRNRQNYKNNELVYPVLAYGYEIRVTSSASIPNRVLTVSVSSKKRFSPERVASVNEVLERTFPPFQPHGRHSSE